MCICVVHVHMLLYAYMRIYIWKCIRMYVCIYIYAGMHVHVFVLYLCTHYGTKLSHIDDLDEPILANTCNIYISMNKLMIYTHTHIYTYIYIYIYIHIYIHTYIYIYRQQKYLQKYSHNQKNTDYFQISFK